MDNCCANKITRGTTPTNSFVVKMDLREATVYAWYSQDDELLFKKCSGYGEINVEENVIYVPLTQADTLMFSQKSKDTEIHIQLGYIFANGKADRSNIIVTTVGKILEDGEMTYVPRNV